MSALPPVPVAVNGVVRFDAVEWDIDDDFKRDFECDQLDNLYEWYSIGSGNHYYSSDFIGWSEVPLLPETK